jgi:hypothetical protein
MHPDSGSIVLPVMESVMTITMLGRCAGSAVDTPDQLTDTTMATPIAANLQHARCV